MKIMNRGKNKKESGKAGGSEVNTEKTEKEETTEKTDTEETAEKKETVENETKDDKKSEKTDKESKTKEKADKKAEKKKEPTEEEKLKKQLADSKDSYLRLMAEYENFRKRSAKERLDLTDTVKGDTLKEILPVFDNFERALGTQTEDEVYKQGVEMIFKQFGDMLNKLGVEIIDPKGEKFDPNIANAVNQIEDPELGEDIVAQVYQKGYKIGDKVIRYAMVVVANT